MRKALFVLLAIALTVALILWVASWFRTPEAVATSAAQTWPNGLGSLENVLKRYPAREANDAAKRLTALATPLIPKDERVLDYVMGEVARGELTIGEPPSSLSDVTTMRELLLNEPVVWERSGGVGEIGGQETQARRVLVMTAARALGASALVKARANDAAAWDDLHAVWKLARSLDGQQEVMEHTASMAMARMINALAWKLPLPAPEWFAEVQQHDVVRRLVEAFQYQAASYWQSQDELFPTKWLANSVEHDRRIAEDVAKMTTCDPKELRMNQLGTDLTLVWRRALRFRAEREATSNAIRIREGKPIETKSVCSDGAWSSDGTTLRFSREIPPRFDEKQLPLVLNVKPAEKLTSP